MYLVTISRLRVDGQPVPLSQLADTLSISPVSVNGMCRKLQDQGLVIYRPYKGALLTTEGEQRANHILRCHRLWEVFLVEKLHFAYEQAHELACQLEHATPDLVADRLDAFLEYPAANPNGDPIPQTPGIQPPRPVYPLTALSAGQVGRVVHCEVEGPVRHFLEEQSIRPGATLTLLAASPAGLLLQVRDTVVSLAQELADAIQVERQEEQRQQTLHPRGPTQLDKPIFEDEEPTMQTESPIKQIPLHQLRAGQQGIVVIVGGKGRSRRRMMDMGLVPGSEVRMVRVAPLGDPIEFNVKGYSLSLRKSEAGLIQVEVRD